MLGRLTFLCLIASACVLSCAFKLAQARPSRTWLRASPAKARLTYGWRRTAAFSKKYGLETQFILMPRNPLTVAALIAGEIDAAIIGPGHLVNAGLGGADLIGIANFQSEARLPAERAARDKEAGRSARQTDSDQRAGLHFASGRDVFASGSNIDPAKISFLTIPGTEINRRLRLRPAGRRDDTQGLHGRSLRQQRLQRAL